MKRTLMIAGGLMCSAAALATTPTIDGVDIDVAHWGASVAVQDTNTWFGDNYNEMDQLFIASDATYLYIGIPGNIADNNAVTLFLDTTAGGDPNKEVLSTNPAVPCPGTIPTIVRMLSGTRFDAGFQPNWALEISVGIFPGQSTSQLVYSCDLTNIAAGSAEPLGIGAVNSGSGDLTLTATTGIKVALNNTNIAGVGDYNNGALPGDTGNDPTSAVTGYEIRIPKAKLGMSNGQTIRVFGYLSNNAPDGGAGPCGRSGYGSNQALPGLGGAGNLATFNTVTTLDFSAIAGTQYVTVVVP